MKNGNKSYKKVLNYFLKNQLQQILPFFCELLSSDETASCFSPSSDLRLERLEFCLERFFFAFRPSPSL